MFHQIKIFLKRNKIKGNNSIDPDEIFLDSQNLPEFDTSQFEGRIEKPISKSVFNLVSVFIFVVGGIFLYKLWDLQVVEGAKFRNRSDNNNLHQTTIFADRGVIYDRNGLPIVWNTTNEGTRDYSLRVYATSTGLSTVLGYIKYPTKDSSGFYYLNKFDPKDGLEKLFDARISGQNGTNIIETDVRGNIVSESVTQPPTDGQNINLSIDLRLQKRLYESLLDIADRAGYKGGAGAIMNIHTGEIIASSNFPEYDSQIMTDGSDNKKISNWILDENHPFLNRVIQGLYTPGSIMKPFVAMGVLDQGVIDPDKQILSTGTMTVPNPYFPDKPSVFVDWKAHGLVDLRDALAVSSNIYFYQVTGGFGSQKGIGIENIEKYTRMFGFGTLTGVDFPGEKVGTIPNPEWKKKTFNGEEWRVGDTYNTSIGQYGFQVTPIQALRAVSAIANGGKLVSPTFLKSTPNSVPEVTGTIDLDQDYFRIVKEGMRQGVTEGTSQPINFPFVKVASKTGTAQIGVGNNAVNSWVIGFWPYDNPKYAYVVVMEKGSLENQFSATRVMQSFLDWINVYAPEYLE